LCFSSGGDQIQIIPLNVADLISPHVILFNTFMVLFFKTFSD